MLQREPLSVCGAHSYCKSLGNKGTGGASCRSLGHNRPFAHRVAAGNPREVLTLILQL